MRLKLSIAVLNSLKLHLGQRIHSAWKQCISMNRHTPKPRVKVFVSKHFYCAHHITLSVGSCPLVIYHSGYLLQIFLGRCYPKDVLKEYMKFCSRNRLHLVSDEIYALSVWENPRLPDASSFTSVLSIDVKDVMDPNMMHVVWGLSKV
jgi:hypothetical protein